MYINIYKCMCSVLRQASVSLRVLAALKNKWVLSAEAGLCGFQLPPRGLPWPPLDDGTDYIYSSKV